LSESDRATIDVAGLAPGRTLALEVGEHRILVCNVDGEFFAVRNVCPHQEFGLDNGRLRGSVIECSLHGGRFDVRTGRPVRAPTPNALKTYPTRTAGTQLEIELPA
jgi:nitrite reductase/ring-hydroxylating ferredoxin subunit